MVLAVSKVIKGSSAIVIPITPVIQIPSDQLRDSFSFSTKDQLLGAATNKHSSPHFEFHSWLGFVDLRLERWRNYTSLCFFSG
jgi:hypothetical protein